MPSSTVDILTAANTALFYLNTALDRTDLAPSIRSTLETYRSKIREVIDAVNAAPTDANLRVATTTIQEATARVAPYVADDARAPAVPRPRPATVVTTDPNAPLLSVKAESAKDGLSKQAKVGMALGALAFGGVAGLLAYFLDRRS